MKKYLLMTLCAVATMFSGDAQSAFKKNEIGFGQVAGYFFDSTNVNYYHFATLTNKPGTNYQVNYTRHINNKLAVTISYQHSWYCYSVGGASYVPEKFADYTVMKRQLSRFSMAVVRKYPLGKIELRPNFGLNYVKGSKFNHYFFYGSDGWKEPKSGGVTFGKIGMSTGISLHHPIWKSFFGEASVQYLRLFKRRDSSPSGVPGRKIADPNQLYFSYMIGMKF